MKYLTARAGLLIAALASPEASDQLFGVDASSAGNAWLVGDSANAASPFHTVALHCC